MTIFRKKSVNSIFEESQKKLLKPTMKTIDLVLFGVGVIVGTGILVLTGAASAQAGPAVIFSFLIAGLACCLAALCYAELASAIPSSGGTYTYVYVAIGELVAHIMGWLMIGGYIIFAAAVANGWSSYFTRLLLGLGVDIPEKLIKIPAEGGIVNLPPIILVALLTIVLWNGASSSKLVNNILVTIKISIVLLFVVVGVFYVEPTNWTNNFSPTGFIGVMTAATTVLLAYLGFDAIATSSEETIDPGKSLPRAIIITMIICTSLYIIVCLILTGVVPYNELGQGDALAFVLEKVGQNTVAGVVTLGAVIGLMAGVLSCMFASIRVVYTMGRDGLIPKKFMQVNKNNVPSLSTWIVGVMTAILASFLPLGQLAELANLSAILSFALISYSTLAIAKLYPEIKRPFKVPAMPYIPVLSMLLFAALLYSVTLTTWIIVSIWTILGLIVYFSYSKKHSKEEK